MTDYERNETYALFDTPKALLKQEKLVSAGHRVIVFPSPVIDRSDAAETVGSANDFDWVVFADAVSADTHLERPRAVEELETVRVCAVGETVADRLRRFHVHSDVIPTRINAANVVESVSEYESNLSGVKILVIKGAGIDEEIVNGFENAGASVSAENVYTPVYANRVESAKSKSALLGGMIDRFCFCETEDVFRFRVLFPRADPADLLAEVEIIATDGETFRALCECGLKPKMEKV